jgi:hypothetical protein
LNLLLFDELLKAAGKLVKPWRDFLATLVGGLNLEVLMIVSGAIFLARRPGAETVARMIEEEPPSPHTEDFTPLLRPEVPSLWVRNKSKGCEKVLDDTGARNVPINERT